MQRKPNQKPGKIQSGLPIDLLTNRQMSEADKFAIQSGISGLHLMQSAGLCVANRVEALGLGPCRVHVMAGPGNNGGDGFVAAKSLKERGYQVSLDLLAKQQQLKSDASLVAESWRAAGGKIHETDAAQPLPQADVIIDALFGAGLDRPVTGAHKKLIEAINDHPAMVISVDVPSGVSGNSGAVLGAAVKADCTVTFFRKKPGHLLYPGRQLAGRTTVHDIGIPARALAAVNPLIHLNHPSLWPEWAEKNPPTAHKYNKGAVLVAAGGAKGTAKAMPGASILAASGAIRAGAGLVTLAYEAAESLNLPLAALMTAPPPPPEGWQGLIEKKKINTVLFGPGAPSDKTTRAHVAALLKTGVHICLDAGALTAFAREPDEFITLLKTSPARSLTLTPHQGEFERLFGSIGQEGKLQAAREASQNSGAIVVLKGADTIIAAPDSKAVINANAPASLATAGTGDVLAGIVSAHLARGLEPFKASASAVYLHALAAGQPLNGLVADDRIHNLPRAQEHLLREMES